MPGMNKATGKAIDGLPHLSQSVADIITTPIGTRLFNRDYGSNVPRRIGQPLNEQTLADIVQDTAEALARWEPRLTITKVRVVVVPETGIAGIVIVSPEAGELEIAL